MKIFLSFFFLSLFIVGAYSQNAEPFQLEQIRDHVYVLYGGNGNGSNVGILRSDKGIILVDAMKAKSAEMLNQNIRKVSDRPVTYVINTHSDSDHIEGNDYFRAKGAMGIIHSNAVLEGKRGDIYFSDRITLDFGNEIVEGYHVESHAISDALIFFRNSNVLFMGDVFTNNWHATYNSGGIEGQLAALELALKISDENTIIVPGHGILANQSGLTRYAEITQRWVAKVSELSGKGYSVDDMRKDVQLMDILNDFIDPTLTVEIGEANVKRFIERTISTELIERYPMTTAQLTRFVGEYGSDGTEEIVIEEGKLLLRMTIPYVYQYELIPLSETEFHPRGSLGIKVKFKINEETDLPAEIIYENTEEILSFSRK